jgi:hypothetical protein
MFSNERQMQNGKEEYAKKGSNSSLKTYVNAPVSFSIISHEEILIM